LKLTVRQIEAIERGDLSSLPGSAFARGFVRNYVRFLGLDPAPFLQAAEASFSEEKTAAIAGMNPQALADMPQGRRIRLPFMPVVFIVLGLLALLSAGAYYGWFESRDEDLLARLLPVEAESVPAVLPAVIESAPPADSSEPAQSEVLSAQEEASSPVASSPASSSSQTSATVSAPATTQSAAVSSLAFEFEGDSWVEVRSEGKLLMSKVNLKGSSQTIQGTPPFNLVIGNASKVKLSWRGKVVDLAPHTKVDVARLNLQ